MAMHMARRMRHSRLGSTCCSTKLQTRPHTAHILRWSPAWCLGLLTTSRPGVLTLCTGAALPFELIPLSHVGVSEIAIKQTRGECTKCCADIQAQHTTLRRPVEQELGISWTCKMTASSSYMMGKRCTRSGVSGFAHQKTLTCRNKLCI